MSDEAVAAPASGRVRVPLLRSAFGATGILGLFQAGVFIIRNQSFMSPETALGFAKLTMVIALATVLVLMPLAWVLRRFHPEWRDDARLRASWSAFLALTFAVVGWMLAQMMISA